jgi:hypothetical protein
MMLTFPVAISTSCTCPDVRPGKAIILSDMLHSPSRLSAVSYADIKSGGFEKEYTRTLFCSTTTIRLRASCTPSRVVLSEHAWAWKMQKPELRPTEKQLQSSLNATERTTVVFGLSIGGRVFIFAENAW